MSNDVSIEVMTEDLIVWRCLHSGPLSRETLDRRTSSDRMSFEHFRERNTSLLAKITRIYGACAIVARSGEKIIGQLRFYPKVICEMDGAGGLCLQQHHAEGPAEDFVDSDFPPLSQLTDKTLVVHCMMTASSPQKENPYLRRGIGTRMVRALIDWAKVNDWERIEADSFEDLPVIYEITGSTGYIFWEKLGFHIVDRHPHPELQDRSQFPEFMATLEEQARAVGIPPERASHRIVVRLDLNDL